MKKAAHGRNSRTERTFTGRKQAACGTFGNYSVPNNGRTPTNYLHSPKPNK